MADVAETTEKIDIQEAADSLGEIIGTTAKADVLDQIFSRFCIGK